MNESMTIKRHSEEPVISDESTISENMVHTMPPYLESLAPSKELKGLSLEYDTNRDLYYVDIKFFEVQD